MLFQKKPSSWPVFVHVMLLTAFACTMLVLWMLPVILMGYPFLVSALVSEAREFAVAGYFTADVARLSVLILYFAHPLIAWDNLMGWTLLSAAAFAVALFPWWWSVYKLFNRRIAWIATVILAFLPQYWLEAIRLDGYSFALLFLFLGFALFLTWYPRRHIPAVVAFGLCFGAAIACRDALLTILPWMVGAYLWQERHHWKKTLILEIAAFGMALYAAYMLPLLPNALQPGMTAVERIMTFIPSSGHSTPGTGHLYPDDYAFTFFREEFDKRIAERAESTSFLVRQEDENYRAIFHVGDIGLGGLLVNGVWLTLNALPDYFFIETVGGAFLWLFIIPGAIVLAARRRPLFLHILGVVISMEIFLRFGLHFHRSHLMDIAWVLALFAAVGVVAIADISQQLRKHRTGVLVAVSITVLIVLQSLQANRKQFAELYRRSATPQIYAAAAALNQTPITAVIAHPKRADFLALVGRTRIAIHPDTITYLASTRDVADPFEYYNVTHIIGYDEEQTRMILNAVPSISLVKIPEEGTVPTLSPLIKYLLHIIR